MIEISKIKVEDILIDDSFNISQLVKEINKRLKNLDSNINSVNTKHAKLREDFVGLKKLINENKEKVFERIDEIIEARFDNEEE